MASNTRHRRRATAAIARSLMIVFALSQAGCDGVTTSQARIPDAVDPELSVPIIEFTTTEIDLGQVPTNLKEPATASFRFRNAGGSPLLIDEVSRDCLCAAAEVAPTTLPPGTDGVVRLKLRRESPRASAATITLRSNDPIYPDTRLSIKWHVIGPVEFEPVSLDFGNIAPNDSKTQSVRLLHHFEKNEPRASKIAKIDCEPGDWLTAEVGSHTAAGDTREDFEIVVAVKADALPGEHRGWIRSPIASGAGPRVSLPVRWYVRPIIEASPAAIFLSTGRPGDTLEKTVALSAEAGADGLEISSVEIKPDDGTLSVVKTLTSKRAVLLTTKARLAGPAGARRWDVTVHCDRPVAQSLTIATSAYVKSTESSGPAE